MFLLLESGKSKRSTVDSKVRTTYPLCSTLLDIYVCVFTYVCMCRYIHTPLIYRMLPSVWGDNVDTPKQVELNADLHSTCVIEGRIVSGPGEWVLRVLISIIGREAPPGLAVCWVSVGKRRRRVMRIVWNQDWMWKWAHQVLGAGLLEVQGTYLGAERGILGGAGPAIHGVCR